MRGGTAALALAALVAAAPVVLAGDSAEASSCKKGCPCGNACISCSKTCHAGDGSSRSSSTTKGGDGDSTPAKSAEGKTCKVERGANGKINRSKSATDAFKRDHPRPANGRHSGTCPGYVIDHIRALKRGGCDEPGNMQWQTTAAAKAKDKWE